MDEIRSKLRSFIIDSFLFGRYDQKPDDDDSLIDQGIIDSTGVLMLVAFLESELGVHVEDDDIVPENLDSLSKLGSFVSRKLKRSISPERPSEMTPEPSSDATLTRCA